MIVVLLIGAILLCYLAGVIGSLFTFRAISTWYKKIRKPFFNPPDFVFGPVWTLLYTLMGISLFLIWQHGFLNLQVVRASQVFYVQLTLNAIWSYFFFGRKEFWLAFGEIIFLLLIIIWTMILFWPISRIAAILFIPYILWVSFASILNFYIARLNS